MLPKNNIPVQMIPLVDTTGDMRPLIFRYEDENHGIQTVKVDNTLSIQECNYVGQRCIKCICKAAVKGAEREILFEMKYLIESHKWIFSKLLS